MEVMNSSIRGIEPIYYRSMSEYTAANLRESIIRGKIAPGAKITETELAETLEETPIETVSSEESAESENVVEIFGKELDANLVYVDATDRFLDLLAGVSDPESKRKIIGAEFINVGKRKCLYLTIHIRS